MDGCSCFTAGVGITFLILAALGGSVCLWDQGVVQAFYAVCLQIFAFAASMLTEFWMDSLPCQVRNTSGQRQHPSRELALTLNNYAQCTQTSHFGAQRVPPDLRQSPIWPVVGVPCRYLAPCDVEKTSPLHQSECEVVSLRCADWDVGEN